MKHLFLSLILAIISKSALAYDAADLEMDMYRCGSAVHIDTLKALIKTESKSNPFAIADAGPVNLPWKVRKKMVRSFYPDSREEAINIAKQLIAAGHTVSLGLTQINDRNLSWMGLSLENVFDPCTNIKNGTQLLAQNYGEALKKYSDVSKALDAALSKYNSGDFVRGKNDGYVDLVYKNAGMKMINTSSSSAKKNNNKGAATVRNFTLGSVTYE